MQRRRRGQVEHAEFHAGNRRLMLDSALMTDGDTEKLRSKLRAVRDANLNAWTMCPELAALLCLPPDEGPHSRMLDLLNQIILISGTSGGGLARARAALGRYFAVRGCVAPGFHRLQPPLPPALMLSATLGFGMDPKDVAQTPDGMKACADAWNFLASFTVVLNMVTCVFGAYFAMQVVGGGRASEGGVGGVRVDMK
jgi:hypothetical protein